MRTYMHVALLLVLPLALLAAGCPEKPAGDGESAAPTPTPTPTPAGRIVNATCPVMAGNAVNADTVPANLVVEFEGQKVGFCCGDCPGTWNSWTDEKKREKLQAALAFAGPTGGTDGHDGHDGH